MVLLTEEPEPSGSNGARADHLKSHAGEVAFAGGKREDDDLDIAATALREAEEEISVPRQNVKVIGTLDQVVSRFGYLVTPVIGLVSCQQAFIANVDELASVLKYHCLFSQIELHRLLCSNGTRIPSYYYEDFRIWGLTALVL